MIDQIDQVLRRVIYDQVRLTKGVDLTREQILVATPKEVGESSRDLPRIFLYLHDIRENLAMRDGSFQVMRKPDLNDAYVRRSAVTLDLAYVVACVAESTAAEHRLLSAVLGALYRSAVIPPRYITPELTSEGAKNLYVAVAQPDHSANANLRSMWTDLGGPSVPIAGLVLTTTFNPFEPTYVRLVRDAVFGMSSGIPESDRPQSIRRRRVSVAGVVFDDAANTPLTGVSVSDTRGLGETTTDSNGVFHLENLPAGPSHLLFRCGGFDESEVTVEISTTLYDPVQPLMVKMGRVGLEVKPSLLPKKSVQRLEIATGTIKYSNGSPVRNVVIRSGDAASTTDSQGNYTLTYDADSNGAIEIEIPTQPNIEGHGTETLSIAPPTEVGGAWKSGDQ